MFRLCLFFTAVWLAAGDTLYFQPTGVKDIICDDKKTSCPDDSTCCSLPSGGYGCCPLPKAVCCSDHQHCCPTGHKCDVSAGTCLTASGARRPWVLKRPAKSLSAKAQAVICPGGQYQCPNGQTCCPQDGGGFACCPFNKATCCSDRSHCCPQDYKCDLSHGTCVKSGAAKVLLGKVQEAATVAAAANTAKKPQYKFNLKTSTGTKSKTKEATPKKNPVPSKIKVTQKVATPTKVQPKVSQKPMAKPIPKKTVNTPKAVKQKANIATQANVKLKAKVAQTQKASNIKVQAVPAAKQGTLPKDNIQTGASAPKTKQTSKSIKKEKRVLETITDKIQATVEAIKETVHRVVGRSGETSEKVSGKKPANSAKSNGEKKKRSKKNPPLVTPTFEGAKPAKTGKLSTPASSSKRKEKVPPPQKTIKTAQVKSKIVTDKKAVASDSNKMHKAKLREVRQKLQKTAETIHHKLGVKGQTTKHAQNPTIGKAHVAQQDIKKKIQQQNLQQQKLQQFKLEQQKLQHQKLKQQELQQQKLHQQKQQQQKLHQQKIEQQKLQQQKIEQQKLQQKLQQQKIEQLQLQQQKLQQQKLQQQLLQQKIEQQKLQQQKLQQQKIEQQKLQQQKLQQQKLQEQKLKEQRLQQQKLQQKLNEQKIQQQKLQQQKLEQQKLLQLKLQQQKLEQQKLQQQKLEQQKIQQQKLQQHKLEQQKLQQQKLQQQKLVEQKLQQQKLQQQQNEQQKLQQKVQQQNLQQQKLQKQKSQQHKIFKASVKDIPKKQTQRSSSGNIGTGRRLLGLAWRFLGLDNTESDELGESDGEQPTGETNHGLDFDAGMEDEQFVVEGDEFEIVEEDGLELVSGVSSHVKVTCPDKSTCPDGTTCCQLETGSYGCCPMPNAVCCSDHIHCCPDGETCDVKAGSCNTANGATSKLRRKFPATVAEESSVTCPGGSTECPSGSTCCHIRGDTYGCCPLPNAVCCNDGLHCCPHGYTCDQGKCMKGNLAIPWMVKTPSQPKAAVTCPGGGTECPSGSTCCLIAGGVYACCPLPSAVCCKDKIHCCPNGYTCGQGKCVKGNLAIRWSVKTPSQPKATVTCPGGRTECPSGSTCCLIAGGVYACCPLPSAVCCKDKIHCCPNGYTCGQGKCVKGNLATPWIVKTPSQPKAAVTCPGGGTECPSGSTCCLIAGGVYACCPLPSAVCCKDKIHCCPNGYACGQGKCVKGDMAVPWTVKTPSQPKAAVTCPGGGTECPSESTCCYIAGGIYSCCPLPNAVCCKDELHCCPHGYTCGQSKCMKGNLAIDWLVKTPSKPKAAVATKMVCPGKKTTCPGDSTCCQVATGGYGCCPLPNAVCCSDKQHCCPAGYVCDTKTAMCILSMNSVPFSTKQPAHQLSNVASPLSAQDIICPDQQSMCPDEATCCKMDSGAWGCCPMPNAICCSDRKHCCPQGTKCDVSAGMCVSTTSSLSISHTLVRPRAKVNLAMATNEAIPKPRLTIVKCADETECPDGDTCCIMDSGKYACCPHNDATCCPDKQHCCPKGYTCGEKSDECKKGSMSVSAIFIARLQSKSPSQPQAQAQVMDIKCADSETSCPQGNTCCAMQAGGYGCCALPNAVCCQSGSCCPKGHTCDASGTRCIVSIPWIKKTTGSPTVAGEEKTLPQACPNTRFKCAAGNTCCQMEGDNWGCCASPDAVCCKNGPYCCPKGLTCSDQPGQCVPAGGAESAKHAATFVQRAATGGHILY